ncbi:MAG: glycosyltransferase family 2 protein [Firmicutes bacterium]|nr:glycosyltransferase family 2 protein [Bacillota bacterium]
MSKTNIKKIDIIVPCYNEGDNIDIFFCEVEKVVSDIEGYDFSYIFIDDGSTDDTLEKIKALACGKMDDAESGDVHYISFSRNFGKEAAMYAGLKAANDRRTDYAVIIDADLQHPPQLIKDMIKITEETGCDSCAARRVTRKGEPRIRSVFARAFYKIMNRYSDIEIIDGAVDFRLMNSKMIKAIVSMPENQRFSKGIFAWVGFHTEWIEFENVKRLSGESKWSVWSLTKYAIAGFLDFAASPLKAVGVFGGITSVGAVIYLIIEILKTLIMGIDVPGYASIICLILFFGGLITAVLSIMGEYIGRMYMETKGRPIYIEKESDLDD